MFSGVTCIRFDYIVLGVINKDEKLAVWKVPEQENTHMIQDSQTPKNKWVLPRGIKSSQSLSHQNTSWIDHLHTTNNNNNKKPFWVFFFFSFFSGSQITSSTGGGSGEASIYDFSFP